MKKKRASQILMDEAFLDQIRINKKIDQRGSSEKDAPLFLLNKKDM